MRRLPMNEIARLLDYPAIVPYTRHMYHQTEPGNAARIVREQGFRLDSSYAGVFLAEIKDYWLECAFWGRRMVGRIRRMLKRTLLEITLDGTAFLVQYELTGAPAKNKEQLRLRGESQRGPGRWIGPSGEVPVSYYREWFVPPDVLNSHVTGIRIIEEPKVPTPPYSALDVLPIQR